LGVVVVALALVSVIHKRPRPQPARLRQIAFQVIPQDATISVDSQAISGATAEVAPGSHTVQVDRIGYISERRPFSDRDATPIQVTLQPEHHVIRILADGVKTPKAMLDDAEVELSPDGSLSAPEGKHTLKFLDGRNQIFSAEFEADPGLPARLLSAPRVFARDIPMVTAVSNLGSHAFAYSSAQEMKAGPKDGELKPVPSDGLEMTLASGSNEIAFDDGKMPASLPVESGNAPVLSIRVGAATKGTLSITSNVDGARVFINGRLSSRLVQAQNWRQLVDPGAYTVQLKLDGYDDSQEQTFTIAAGKLVPGKFELALSVTTGSLQVQGGTAGAQILLDGSPIGTLDQTGSFGPYQIQPGERSIRFRKENFEPGNELKKTAIVKGTVQISGQEATLKPFGTLVLASVQPPNAEVTIQRQGGQARTVTTRTIPLQEGIYTVRGTAGDQYNQFVKQGVQINPGQPTEVSVALTLKPPPENKAKPIEIKPQPRPVLLTDLFRGKEWKQDEKGFWTRETATYFAPQYFDRVFEVFIKKLNFGRTEKLEWRTYINDDDYYDFELDDKNFRKREVVADKDMPWEKQQPLGIPQGQPYILEINVKTDGIVNKIGNVTDSINRNVTGWTGLTGKSHLKLIK
jgi:hypothetical protein